MYTYYWTHSIFVKQIFLHIHGSCPTRVQFVLFCFSSSKTPQTWKNVYSKPTWTSQRKQHLTNPGQEGRILFKLVVFVCSLFVVFTFLESLARDRGLLSSMTIAQGTSTLGVSKHGRTPSQRARGTFSMFTLAYKDRWSLACVENFYSWYYNTSAPRLCWMGSSTNDTSAQRRTTTSKCV